jgi:hypothetical protein
VRAIATLLTSLAMALTALGLAFAAPGGPKRVGLELQSASGAVHIANSRDGQAVFSAAGMRPGEGVSGTVRIGNDGDIAGAFSIRPGTVQDTPGPNGGLLSGRVQLVLFDVTDVQHPVTVYAGPPAGLPAVTLGTLVPGSHRDYLFAATLPDSGLPGSDAAGDNLFQGSGLSLGFEWRATSAAEFAPAATPTPTPAPTVPPTTPTVPPTTPTVPTTPTTPTTPKVVIPTGEALADALGLPSARACVSRRKFTIRLKAPLGVGVVSATITINGKVKARVKGGKTRAPVDLRGLPMGKVKVSIATKAADGRTYKSTRTYRTCGLKKKVKPKRKH